MAHARCAHAGALTLPNKVSFFGGFTGTEVDGGLLEFDTGLSFDSWFWAVNRIKPRLLFCIRSYAMLFSMKVDYDL